MDPITMIYIQKYRRYMRSGCGNYFSLCTWWTTCEVVT